MSIEEKTVFVTRGKQFDTIEAAQEYRADLIGAFLDQKPGLRIDRKTALELVEHMVAQRSYLRSLLDY